MYGSDGVWVSCLLENKEHMINCQLDLGQCNASDTRYVSLSPQDSLSVSLTKTVTRRTNTMQPKTFHLPAIHFFVCFNPLVPGGYMTLFWWHDQCIDYFSSCHCLHWEI